MISIAVDAMGGDHAPSAVVDGAVAAARHLDGEDRARRPHGGRDRRRWRSIPTGRSLGLEIVDAPDVIAMTESPAAALRRKPGASIRVAADLVARKQADALVSAGHTGATVMAAYAAFGTIPGVDRPALAAAIPTLARPAVLRGCGRQRRVPAASPAAVRGDGQRLCAGRVRRLSARGWACCRSAKRRPRATI